MRVRFGMGLCLALALPGCDGCGRSGDHDPVFIPLPPTGVAAVPLSTTTIQVTWTDQSQDEYTFIVQTSPDSVVWTDKVTVPLNVTSAVVGGLVPGVQVFVQVIAFNSAGRSPPAGPVAVTPPLPAGTTQAAGPAAIAFSCAALDTTRNLMFVFGGSDGFGGDSNLLHACDLSPVAPTWSTVTPAVGNTPPAARFGSTMIYDPLRDRLVVFGGQVGSASTDELWEFALSTSQWALIPTSGTPPAPRQHHTAVYDRGLARMVIYGGDDGLGGAMSDVVALTLPEAGIPEWSTFPLGAGPGSRSRHSAIYDGDSRRMLVFAGLDNDFTDGSSQAQDVWTLDLSVASPSSWLLLTTSGTPPAFRDGHVAVWDSANQQMAVYGGTDEFGTVLEDVWTLTLGPTPTWRSWTPATTAGPRCYGVAAFDAIQVRMIVFGGLDDTFTPSDQTWSLGL